MPTRYSQLTPEEKQHRLELNRKWRLEHPDQVVRQRRRQQGKATLERLKEKLERHLPARDRFKWLFGQVLHHAERGRDLAQIVVWLNVPASILGPVFKKAKRLLASRARKLKPETSSAVAQV